MIEKVSIFLLVTLSLIGGEGEIGKSYYSAEKEAVKNTEFIENGVRLEYKSELTVEEEIDRIQEVLGKEFALKVKKENSMILEGTCVIDVGIWKEDKYTYVDARVINEEENLSTKRIKGILNKLESTQHLESKYYIFYKGKVNNISDEYREKIDKIDLLKIENGYTGKIKLGKDNVNFGLVNYDTGLEMIIGTPIIFTTY